ncbi:MAG: hypothetical protein RJA36_2321 [Pseudomonadota bacterium]
MYSGVRRDMPRIVSAMTPAQKIEAEISAMQRDGVHVLVWADSVQVHRTLCKDRAGLDACARIHGGIAVHLFPHLPEPVGNDAG